MEKVVSTDSKRILVFRLENEEYGVDIRKVTTIIKKDMAVTRVPKAPEFVNGVINLRGEIISVIDLRKKFNIIPADDTEETRIIIIKVDDMAVGFVVDSVAEVIQLKEASIENITGISTDKSLDYIYGVGKLEGRIVTLLNLEKIVGLNEI
jgi:purine-binding chemotaxis protein CheW